MQTFFVNDGGQKIVALKAMTGATTVQTVVSLLHGCVAEAKAKDKSGWWAIEQLVDHLEHMAKIAQKGMEDIVENTSGVADASVLNWGFKLDATPEGSVTSSKRPLPARLVFLPCWEDRLD